MTESTHRPLRELFPTHNGRRVRRCPWCEQPTFYSQADGGYVCCNQQGHAGQMFPDAKRIVFA